jgi:hypothetical protein
MRIEPLKRIEKMWDLARKTEGVNHWFVCHVFFAVGFWS